MSEMEIDPDEDILNRAAADGSMDYTAWPGLLSALLSRIDKTVHTEFPIPRIPPPRPPARVPSPRLVAPLSSSDPVEAPGSSGTTPSSQETNKENANPSRTTVSDATTTSSTVVPPTGNPLAQTDSSPQVALPPQVAAMLNEITSTLTTGFANYPPHTIQRLSELVLRPRQHYRHLVAYLHALDRVVHVTSGANTYPLPPAEPDMRAMSNGAGGAGGSGGSGPGLTINPSVTSNIGSDEALGGALLTPIPWLSKSANGGGSDGASDTGSSSPLSSNSARPQQQSQLQSQSQRQIGSGSRKQEPQLRTESTETIEGPNGMGSIETVTIALGGLVSTGSGTVLTNRGVTQGNEFFREEQRAGTTSSSQNVKNEQQQQQETSPDINPAAGAKEDEDSAMAEGDNLEDEVPHARGPEEIGLEDMGPQTTTSSTRGPDGTLEVQGIDVEAAVGRRQSTPEQTRLQLESAIPRSPKREATDKLESPAAKKRAIEGEEVTVKSGDDKAEEQAKNTEGAEVPKDQSLPQESSAGTSTGTGKENDPESVEKTESSQAETVKPATGEGDENKTTTDALKSAEQEEAPTSGGVENTVAESKPSEAKGPETGQPE